MTDEEWWQHLDRVTKAMNEYFVDFTTCLYHKCGDELHPVGTGSFINVDGVLWILTCKHVVKTETLYMEPGFVLAVPGRKHLVIYRGPWVHEPNGRDASAAWFSFTPDGGETLAPLALQDFLPSHSSSPEEVLFFRAHSVENVRPFGDHIQSNTIGFCTQEIDGSYSDCMFDVHWHPAEHSFEKTADKIVKLDVKAEKPDGISGSLIWNTSYVKINSTDEAWTPAAAKVSGLLVRHNEDRGSLVALDIKCIYEWLSTLRPE